MLRHTNWLKSENNNNSAFQAPDMESVIRNGALAEGKGDKMAEKYSIHIHSIRKRLADTEGLSAKACIDGLRDAGILPNDSAKFIKEVTFSQEVGKKDETIITVTN